MAHHIFPDLPCLPSNFRSRAPSGPFWAQQGHGPTQRNWIRSNFPLTARRKRHQAPGVPFVPKLLAMQAPVLWLRAVLTPKLRRSSNLRTFCREGVCTQGNKRSNCSPKWWGGCENCLVNQNDFGTSGSDRLIPITR